MTGFEVGGPADVVRYDLEPGVVVLPAEAGRYRDPKRPGGFSAWWASRALHEPGLCDEDREMALAAYSRAFDRQMGTVGKGTSGGVREGFPHGGDPMRKLEAARAAERAAAEIASAVSGEMFSMGEGSLWGM